MTILLKYQRSVGPDFAFARPGHRIGRDRRLYDLRFGRIRQAKITATIAADLSDSSTHERDHDSDGHLHAATSADAVAHYSDPLFTPGPQPLVMLEHRWRDSGSQRPGLGWTLARFAKIDSLESQEILQNAIHALQIR